MVVPQGELHLSSFGTYRDIHYGDFEFDGPDPEEAGLINTVWFGSPPPVPTARHPYIWTPPRSPLSSYPPPPSSENSYHTPLFDLSQIYVPTVPITPNRHYFEIQEPQFHWDELVERLRDLENEPFIDFLREFDQTEGWNPYTDPYPGELSFRWRQARLHSTAASDAVRVPRFVRVTQNSWDNYFSDHIDEGYTYFIVAGAPEPETVAEFSPAFPHPLFHPPNPERLFLDPDTDSEPEDWPVGVPLAPRYARRDPNWEATRDRDNQIPSSPEHWNLDPDHNDDYKIW